MQLALRQAYGVPFGLMGLGDCGDGSDPAYDAICGTTPSEPLSTPIDYQPSTVSTSPLVSTYPVTDSSGVQWTCDTNGNCCDPSNNCQQGPPQILSAVPPNATAGQTKSASAANQSNASLVATLAAEAAAIGKTGAGTGIATSIQCAPGVAVPIGQKCPGVAASSTSPCPAGMTLSGSTCVASIVPGISNSTLGIIAIAFVALMVMGKKR